MDFAEAREKVYQLCTLWELYVDASYELARKSKLPTVITIFAMENELRKLKGRGHFPIPKITQQGI